MSYWRLGDHDGNDLGSGDNDFSSPTDSNEGPFPAAGVGTTSHPAQGGYNADFDQDVFSLEAWFNHADLTGATEYGNTIAGSRSSGYEIGISKTAGSLGLLTGAYCWASGQCLGLASEVTVDGNGWHHAAITKDSSSFKLYLDGEVVDTGAGHSDTFAPYVFRIGRAHNSCCDFNGMIDEVAYYDRVLSASEIASRWAFGEHAGLGMEPDAPMAGDPVNVASGNFAYHAEPDLASPPQVYGQTLSRAYNSQDGTDGWLGEGWLTNFDVRVLSYSSTDPANGDVWIRFPDGREVFFDDDTGASNSWTPNGIQAELSYSSGSTSFTLMFPSGESWVLDASATGWLESMANGLGESVAVVHTSGVLTSATHQIVGFVPGRRLLVTGTAPYTVAAQVWTGSAWAAESPARQVVYDLDTNGRLEWAQDPTGGKERYAYTNARVSAIDHLVQVDTAPDPDVETWASEPEITNTYDSAGRVSVQELPGAATIRFTYDSPAANQSTVIHDPDGDPGTTTGEETVVYSYDDAGVITGMADDFSEDAAPTYANGQLTDFADRRGADFKNVYDGEGRLSQRVFPDPATGALPGSLPGTRYEQLNYVGSGDSRVSSYRDRNGKTTTFTYDGSERIPATVTDPSGIITCMASADGLITQTIAGATSTGCTAGQVVTQLNYGDDDGTIAGCPERLLCSVVVDPGTGNLNLKTVYTYTDANQVESVTEAYGTSASGGSPGATTTSFEYDAAGRLSEVTTPATNTGASPPVYPIKYGYDLVGRLKWVSAENNPYTGTTGNPSVLYAYTTADKVDTMTTYTDLPSGANTVTNYDYDNLGNLTAISEADGDSAEVNTSYTFSSLGRLERMKVAPGTGDEVETEFAYDLDGNLTKRIVDPGAGNLNLTWAVGHDYWGRVTCEADPLDAKEFTTDGNLECIDSDHDSTFAASYEYDNVGHLTKVTRAPQEETPDPEDPVETYLTPVVSEFTYTDAGRLFQTKAETGKVGVTNGLDPLKFRYDVVEERTYDAAGRLDETRTPPPDNYAFTWSSGSGKVVTEHNYDEAGRLSSVTGDPGGIGATTSYAYDPHGWLLSTTSPEGRVRSNGYDGLGRVTSTTRPDEDSGTISALRTFTPTGQLWKETAYAASPVIGTTPTTTYAYTANGWLASAEDALGTDVTYTYNKRGQRTMRQSTKTSGATPVCPDPLPNPRTHTCVIESWTYDAAGRLATEVVPLGNFDETTVTRDYDAAGRLKYLQEPVATNLFRCETPGYDGHRINEVKYWTHASSCSGTPASPDTVSFGYDWHNRRTSLVDPRGGSADPTTFEYDQAGRLIKRLDEVTGEEVGWRWTIVGNPLRLLHNDGALFKYTHDRLNRMDVASVWFGAWVPIVDHTFDKDGLLTHEALNNASARWRDFDYYASGQLDTYGQNLNSADLVETALTWGTDARVSSVCTDASLNGTCSVTPVDYIYDAAGQLRGTGDGCVFSGGVPTGCDATWAFDGHGVRTAATAPGMAVTYTSNRADQITLADFSSGGTDATYGWDYAGRLDTVDTGTDANWDWTKTGELDKVTFDLSPNDTVYSFDYDGDGNRMRTEVSTDADAGPETSVDYIWDPTQPVPQLIDALYDADGDGAGAPAHNRQNYGMNRISSAGKWYSYDWMGSAIESVDFPDNPTSYDPFGVATGAATTLFFGYRGEMQMGNTSLDLRNRDYSPELGVFTSRDPIDGARGTPDVANAYDYVGNDPVQHTDPLGLCRMVDGNFVFAANSAFCEDARAGAADKTSGCYWKGSTATFFDWDPLSSVSYLDNGGCQVELSSGARFGEWWTVYGDCMQLNIFACDKQRAWDLLVEFIPGIDCYRLLNEGGWGNAAWCGFDVFPGIGKIDELIQVLRFSDEFAPAARVVDDIPSVCPASFSAETEVLMANGERKEIADVKVGEYVLATNPETGETGAREVIATLPHTDQLLTLNTSAGEIVTTENHKYWNATDHAWQESQDLDAGDRLLIADGDEVLVEGLDWSTVHTAPAYDLTIDDLHTFYVGAGEEALLVHNCNLAPRMERAGDLSRYTESQSTRSFSEYEYMSNDELIAAINAAKQGDGINVSAGGQILDGHHRWDELLRRVADGRIDPDTPIQVWVLEAGG